jgi:NADH/NAD ratio-sensing transcriptional regulator Rex
MPRTKFDKNKDQFTLVSPDELAEVIGVDAQKIRRHLREGWYDANGVRYLNTSLGARPTYTISLEDAMNFYQLPCHQRKPPK